MSKSRPFLEDGKQTGVVVDGERLGQARVRRIGDDRFELAVMAAPGTFLTVVVIDGAALSALHGVALVWP